MACYRVYGIQSIPGYLENGVPPRYGSGAEQIVASIHKNPLSKWMNIAVFSGTGLTSLAGGEFVRRLPVISAAILIGTIVFLPAAIFLLIPSRGPDRRLASRTGGHGVGAVRSGNPTGSPAPGPVAG